MLTSDRIRKRKEKELSALKDQNRNIREMFKAMKSRERCLSSSSVNPSARPSSSSSSNSSANESTELSGGSSGGNIATTNDANSTGEPSITSDVEENEHSEITANRKRKRDEETAETKLLKWQTLHPSLKCFEVKQHDSDPTAFVAYCRSCKAQAQLKLSILKKHSESKLHLARASNQAVSMIEKMKRPVIERVCVIIHAALVAIVVGAAQRTTHHLLASFQHYGACVSSSWMSYGYSWEFVVAAARVVTKKLVNSVNASPAHHINYDLSTDIVTKKRLAVIFTYFDSTVGRVKQNLVGFMGTIGNGLEIKKKIMDLYNTAGINPDKCVGACTDGGGAEKKAFELLVQDSFFPADTQWSHCLAHRIALAVEDAWSASEFCKRVESLFIAIYSEFSRSSPRVGTLKELQEELDDDAVNTGISRFVKYYRVRWLGKVSCLSPILKHSAALLLYFDKQENQHRAPLHIGLLRGESGDGEVAKLWLVLTKIGEHVVRLQSQSLNLSDACRLVDDLEASITMCLSQLTKQTRAFALNVLRKLAERIPKSERQGYAEQALLSYPIAVTSAKGMQVGADSTDAVQEYVIKCRNLRSRGDSLEVKDLAELAAQSGDEDLIYRVVSGLIRAPTSCGAERSFSVLTRELSKSRKFRLETALITSTCRVISYSVLIAIS